MSDNTISQKLGAEFIGTAFLLAAVVGPGMMAENLAGGNVALALLCNTIPTGAIRYVLITMLGPISGAHFNPAVTLAFSIRGEIDLGQAGIYVVAQIIGAVVGVLAAHFMFDDTLLQVSSKARASHGQWFSEWVATFGLVTTILLTLRANAAAVPTAVALYITSAYWFTASTSFANPAVTIGRTLTDTFAGIMPVHMPAFILAQAIGAACAVGVCRFLTGRDKRS